MPIPSVPAKLVLSTDTFADQVDVINQIIDVISFVAPYHKGGMFLFDDVINEDITIESDKRGLAIDVTIAAGKTVTVEPGATFLVL